MVFTTKENEGSMDILNINDAKVLIGTNKVVFVTGVTGQDGSHMVDHLLKTTDYLIFGGVRRLSIKNHENIEHLDNNSRFHLVNFDLSDAHSINKIVESLKPDYFINLAAQTFVGSSWDFPTQTWECNTTGVIHILEAIRQHKPSCRFYNAGSSEEFGDVAYIPQDENHPAKPRSPYGASKSAARQLVKVYRESYRLYAIQGLLFNHEGTRRGEEFVTRKITKGVARIKKAILEGKSFDPIEKDYMSTYGIKADWHDQYGILKYGKGQKFTNHIDDHKDYHRRVSTVYYLNDNYIVNWYKYGSPFNNLKKSEEKGVLPYIINIAKEYLINKNEY